MTEPGGVFDPSVGSEIAGPVRVVTPERIEWYDSAMLSAATGELAQVGSNIHTDLDYARSEGLAGIIADGMISTNWISAMLVEHFGMAYLAHGELRTKYIKPIFLGMRISVGARVVAAEKRNSESTLYTLDVWCVDDDGTKRTVGDARIPV